MSSTCSVFGTSLDTLNPDEFGPNGYAVYDMVLSTLESGKGLMQVHFVLQPPRLFDSAVIKSGEQVVGVMVVELDLEYLLAGFDPDYSSLGFISLTQYNGRQRVSHLREWGDPSIQDEIPDRIPVPGTLFRIEFPQPTTHRSDQRQDGIPGDSGRRALHCRVCSSISQPRGVWKKQYEARKREIEIRIAKTRAEKALQMPEPAPAKAIPADSACAACCNERGARGTGGAGRAGQNSEVRKCCGSSAHAASI